MSSVLRPMADTDADYVLELNEAFVDLLAPMDEDRLNELRSLADHADIILDETGERTGFLITMAGGIDYDSINYQWFTERFAHDFYYLDRVVLAPQARRSGLASRAYTEIEDRAAQLASRMALEINVDPPNEASLAFHERRGYIEIGRQEFNGHITGLRTKELNDLA